MSETEDKPAIYTVINQGTHFKGVFTVLKEAKLVTATLIFTAEGISMNEKTQIKDKSALLLAPVLGGIHTQYDYNLTVPELPFCVDVKDMNNILQSCAKNDSITMYILAKDLTQLYIQFDSNKAAAGHENLHFITCRQTERKNYVPPRYSIQRTAAGLMSEFDGIMKSIKKSHAKTITITCEPDRVVIERDKTEQGSVSMYTFGKVDYKNAPSKNLVYLLDSHAIGVLHKLSTLCFKSDNVGLTAEEGKPLQITTSIGNFGVFNLIVYSSGE